MSSGSGSSDTASGSEEKCESPTPSATPSAAASHGSSNTVKRRGGEGGHAPRHGPATRPRHLKPKKDIYKQNSAPATGNGEILYR